MEAIIDHYEDLRTNLYLQQDAAASTMQSLFDSATSGRTLYQTEKNGGKPREEETDPSDRQSQKTGQPGENALHYPKKPKRMEREGEGDVSRLETRKKNHHLRSPLLCRSNSPLPLPLPPLQIYFPLPR